MKDISIAVLKNANFIASYASHDDQLNMSDSDKEMFAIFLSDDFIFLNYETALFCIVKSKTLNDVLKSIKNQSERSKE